MTGFLSLRVARCDLRVTPYTTYPCHGSIHNSRQLKHFGRVILMNGDPFKTPLNRARLDGQSRPTTAAKRDSLAAELERGMENP